MREEDLIFIKFELRLKTKCEVETAAFLFHPVLIVAYIVAVPLPPDPRFIIRLFLGIHQGFHALIVRTLWLDQVYYVKFVFNICSRIAHFEEKPLSIVVSAIVIFQNQVIFKISDLNCTAQVSRFKSRFKNEGGI